MSENQPSQSMFSDQAIQNFANLYHSLLKVRNRLLSEGYTISDGQIIPPTGKNKKPCYNPGDYDEIKPKH